ncbi:MAG: hypothetical protein HON55_04080 [Legionellales bacterium]|jgi:cytoskeletal protein RodZ|nr:hypothetical protein [Legionellales bacterium]
MTKKRITAGETLKLARETKNLTLHDISEKTKVSNQCLNDIENNLHPEQGFSIYTKGHLKLYCEAVGVPVDDIMSTLKKDGFEYVGTKIAKPEAVAVASNHISIKNLTNNISVTQIAILMTVIGWIIFINNPSKTEKQAITSAQRISDIAATERQQATSVKAIKTSQNKQAENNENDIER